MADQSALDVLRRYIASRATSVPNAAPSSSSSAATPSLNRNTNVGELNDGKEGVNESMGVLIKDEYQILHSSIIDKCSLSDNLEPMNTAIILRERETRAIPIRSPPSTSPLDYSPSSNPNTNSATCKPNLFSSHHTSLPRSFDISPSPLSFHHRILPNYLRHLHQYDSRVFCSKFNHDGSLFLVASQDRRIRLYDTEKIFSSRPIKEIDARNVGWSIVDTDFSPDGRFFIYSTWSNYVHLVGIDQIPSEQTGNGGGGGSVNDFHSSLDFQPSTSRFCLFAIKFAPQGREIVAGSSDRCLYVYDLEKNIRTVALTAHDDDVNAIAFAERDNPLVFASGSDDCFIKIWDRRIMKNGTKQNGVGVFIGHEEGITSLDSRGDGRYFLSNGKDQTMKLWDLRKMSAPEAVKGVGRSIRAHDRSQWDYRWEMCPRRSNGCMVDGSLMTYRGHRVLETLIRCYFSPEYSTGNRYAYTGSQDGNIYIFDILTGQMIDVLRHHFGTVRDIAWHPSQSLLLSASWDCSIGVWDSSHHQHNHPPDDDHHYFINNEERDGFASNPNDSEEYFDNIVEEND